MLNLLIISDSSKAAYVKTVLQPDLKVIIDLVTDFDLGLKNVFEKRPSTVCIQDQIGGVTGENVARHIQMLLGNNAPKFILLHTGNGKARLIKGLYDHILDLSQSNETVAEDLTNTLKSLLGDTWDKIYTPPRLTPALVRSSPAVPEQNQTDTDKPADVAADRIFTSITAETEAISSAQLLIPRPGTETPPPAESGPAVTPAAAVPPPGPEAAIKPKPPEPPEPFVNPPPPAAPMKPVIVTPHEPAPVKQSAPPGPAPKPVSSTTASFGAPPLVKNAAAVQVKRESPVSTAPVTAKAAVIPLPEKPPAVTSHTLPSARELSPSDGPPVTEELLGIGLPHASFYSRYSTVISSLFVITMLFLAGGWYLAGEAKPPHVTVKQAVTQKAEVNQPQSAVPAVVTAPAPPPSAPVQTAAAPLPAFVPEEGHDPGYALKNPGWERYVADNAEFRLFSSGGKIQAVQVLVVNEAPLSRSMMKSVLQEFAGSSDYRITSRIREAGIRVESGTVSDGYDVMLYRKKGALVAFIVSIS